jgi:acyl-CoA synthetase (NDP forming)
MAADHAEFQGLALPQPAPETERVLRSAIPDFGSPRNPCDLTAQVATNPKSFEECMLAMLNDEQYATVVFPVVYHNPAPTATPARMRTLEPMAAASGKPICIAWVPESLEGPGAEAADVSPNLVLFRSTRRMMNALRLWFQRHDPKPPVGVVDARASAAAAAIVPGAATLMEAAAKQAFATAGMPVVAEHRAKDAAGAVGAAQALGFPVVLKLDSPDVAHKTEVGGVELNLSDEAAVTAAFGRIMTGAAKHAPKARVDGVLVQRMEARGVELILGARRDPQFGTMVLVGLGGVQAELWKDVALDVAPVSPEGAMAMLRSLKAFPLLDGFRGSAPMPVEQIAATIAQFSSFAAAMGDRLEEAEINPLVCRPDGCVAVDGLMILSA